MVKRKVVGFKLFLCPPTYRLLYGKNTLLNITVTLVKFPLLFVTVIYKNVLYYGLHFYGPNTDWQYKFSVFPLGGQLLKRL